MRIAHISYSDGRAGAYAAAYRLHRALVGLGADSHMLVSQATRGDERVHLAPAPLGRVLARAALPLDQLPARIAGAAGFSPGWASAGLPARLDALRPDVAHLHWTIGAASVGDLPRIGRPLVWTLHDMWPFTGGCHYSGDCERFVEGCGRCPLLGARRWADLSRLTWARKRRAWAGLKIALVAPSRWMAEQAARSALFAGRPIEVIAYSLDLGVYRPGDRLAARARLGLPPDQRLLLFGGMRADADPRKGYDLLVGALERLVAQGRGADLALATFGSEAAAPVAGLRSYALGRLNDDAALATAYAAADLFVAPSREDNLPNTVCEAMACGLPVAAFAVGGLPELVEHGASGYLARPFDIDDLAAGIAQIMADDRLRATMGQRARALAEERLDAARQARRYLELYERLLA